MLVSQARISFARLWCGWVVHIRLFIAKSLPLSIRNRKRFVSVHFIPAPLASAISRVVISGSFPRASLMRERKGAFRFRVIPG